MLLNRYAKPLALLIASSALLLGTQAAASDTLRLNFGVYSSNKPSAMVRVFKPALVELERRMSAKLRQPVDIRMQIAKDYDQGISDLTTGKVDFSRFGPASYIEAKGMNKDVEILAMESDDQDKVFYGIIAVKGDSDISDVHQLRGKSFAFGDEGSTIGRFLSQLYLEKNGIRAGDLSNYEYLGRHDKVGTAVGAGDFDAGALNESTFKKLVDKGVDIKELARFPNVTKPWIARSGLDPQVYTALKESLLEITDEATLKNLKIDGFLQGDDADYEEIRIAMQKNYVFFSDPIITSGIEERSGNDPLRPVQAVDADASQPEDASDVMTATVETVSVQKDDAALAMAESGSAEQITINISLPRSLFESENGTGARSVTINLNVPEGLDGMALESASAEDL